MIMMDSMFLESHNIIKHQDLFWPKMIFLFIKLCYRYYDCLSFIIKGKSLILTPPVRIQSVLKVSELSSYGWY